MAGDLVHSFNFILMKTTLHSNNAAFLIDYTQENDEFTVQVNGDIQCIRLLATQPSAFTFVIDGQPLQTHWVYDGQRTIVALNGNVYEFFHAGEKYGYTRNRETRRGDPEIRSPMPGKILEIRVAEGDVVETGQVLVVLEAMKMENSLTAEGAAQIKKIHASSGDLVDLGQLLVELEFSEVTAE